MKIKINNKEYDFNKDETVIQIADRNGIHIPRFCYHDKLSIAANDIYGNTCIKHII